MVVAPHDCRLARSFLNALDVASCGQVALALMSLGLLEGVLGREVLDWDLEAMKLYI